MAASRDPYKTWLGIPPGPQPPNYYRLLGLADFESRPEVIEAAAEQQTARLLNLPAEARGPEVQTLLAEIAAARLCLLQPARKLAYDEALRRQSGASGHRGAAGGEAPLAADTLPQLLSDLHPTSRPASGRRRRRWWLAGCGVAAAIAIAAWLVFAPGAAPPTPGTLVLDLPLSQRAGAAVRIDGQPREVPPLGPLEYRCPAGEVLVEVSVPGRRVWTRTVSVRPGQKHLVTLPWETISAGEADAGIWAEPSGSASGVFAPRGKQPAPASAGNNQATSSPQAGPGSDVDPDTAIAGKRLAEEKPSEGPASAVTGQPARSSPPPAPPGDSAEGMADFSARPAQRPALPSGPQPQDPAARPASLPPQSQGSPAVPPAYPARIPTLAEFDRPLAEAWALILSGESRHGYEQLLALFKKERDDLRVAFSLGLLEALLAHNWPEAEKRFAVCQRLAPEHPAVLNNLALVRLRTGQEHLALRHWEALVTSHPALPEVVQNLRRFQALAHAGQLRLAPARLKTLDELAAQAAKDGTPLRPNVGFLYLPLRMPDGQPVGWNQPRFYHDRWCVVCSGRGAVRCPDPDCARGSVRASAPRLLYVDPLTRARVVQSVPVRAACRVCKGEGWIDCKTCNRGIDPRLKDAQDPLAQKPATRP